MTSDPEGRPMRPSERATTELPIAEYPTTEYSASQQPQVIVVGCGFGGLATLKELRDRFRVLVLDKNGYTTFQPLLYQVATAGLAPSDVACSARAVAGKCGARFRHGELTGINAAGRTVSLADGSQIGYDYLILATGATAAYHGVAGAAEHTRSLYTRRDAIGLRDELLGGLDRLAAASQVGRAGQYVITIVGGNATGVELAGSLAELRNSALRTAYPEIDPTQVEVELAERGADVRLGTAIKEVKSEAILLASGETLHSDLTVWAAGVQAPPAAGAWGLEQGE